MSPISSQPSASEINVELGRASNAAFSMDGAEERALAKVPTGPISMNDFIGKSAEATAYTGTLTVGTGPAGVVTLTGFENLSPYFYGDLQPPTIVTFTCARLAKLQNPNRFDIGFVGAPADNDSVWSVMDITGITDPSFNIRYTRSERSSFVPSGGASYWYWTGSQPAFVVGHQYTVKIYNTANPPPAPELNYVSSQGNAFFATNSVQTDQSKWMLSIRFLMATRPSLNAAIASQRSGLTIYGPYLYGGSNPTNSIVGSVGSITSGQNASYSPANVWSAGILYHLLMSFDSTRPNASKMQVYLNDAPLAMSGITVVPATYTNPLYVFRDPEGTEALNFSKLSEFYLAYGQALDITVEANRRKFNGPNNEPVDLGPDGSAPTGVTPSIYMGRDMKASDWNAGTNLGNLAQPLFRQQGGNFVDVSPP